MKASSRLQLPASQPLLAARFVGLSLLCAVPALGLDSTAVKRVDFASLGQVTQVAIETGGKVPYRTGRLLHPDRLYFDLLGTTWRGKTNKEAIPVGDKLLKRIRIGQKTDGITRVVLDLQMPVDFTVSQNPDRLAIELRQLVTTPPAAPAETATEPVVPPELEPSLPESKPAGPVSAAQRPEGSPAETAKMQSPPCVVVLKPGSQPALPLAQPAKRNHQGTQSLTRALGLKVTRVVLDPGHGGDDTGAISGTGLTEKDLALDVAQRLGGLIEERLDSEVIYTRSEDSFVPLDARPAVAKEKQADLLISIHANWSRSRSVAGFETYYLHFANGEASLDVAARENAGSNKSVHELQDLIQKIALNEKVNESREFALSVQSSFYHTFSRTGVWEKSRGVKQAPFVVLVGSGIPSILVEIGFLSNPREENLLKRSEHRQRIAEALYKGVAQYVGTLSHFDMAGRNAETTSRVLATVSAAPASSRRASGVH